MNNNLRITLMLLLAALVPAVLTSGYMALYVPDGILDIQFHDTYLVISPVPLFMLIFMSVGLLVLLTYSIYTGLSGKFRK